MSETVPCRQLESIVRNFATKHAFGWVLKKLGNHKLNHIANAKSSFARDMVDAEVPLVFLDRSFFGNGKAGLLITDRRVYSSTVSYSIPLADIRIATVELKSTAEVMLGSGTKDHTLFVNGAPLYTELATMGRKPLTFYAEVLNALANAVRQGTDTSAIPVKAGLAPQAPTSSPTDSRAALSGPGSGSPHRPGGELPEYIRIAAALVCADKPADEAFRDLGAVGVSEASARPLIEDDEQASQLPTPPNRHATTDRRLGVDTTCYWPERSHHRSPQPDLHRLRWPWRAPGDRWRIPPIIRQPESENRRTDSGMV